MCRVAGSFHSLSLSLSLRRHWLPLREGFVRGGGEVLRLDRPWGRLGKLVGGGFVTGDLIGNPPVKIP